MARFLFIDDLAREKIAQVIAHASNHHYTPGPNAPVPGDDDKFVVQLDTFRCVFSFTQSDGAVWRHLSISIPQNYPNPAAAFLIAEEFGFTGWDGKTIDQVPQEWIVDIDKQARCIVLAQPIAANARAH